MEGGVVLAEWIVSKKVAFHSFDCWRKGLTGIAYSVVKM